jgi:hypothetical protein
MLCPICKVEMTQTVNTGLYMCLQKREKFLSELDIEIKYWDSVIYVNHDNRIHTQIYEIPPYKFTIQNLTNFSAIEKAELSYKDIPFKVSDSFLWGYKKILEIDAILDLPWDNRDKVLERVKGYLTFS